MRTILILFVLLATNFSIAQKTTRDVVINFWDTAIQPIIDLDKEKIIEHTNFPLQGSWGYQLDLSTGPDEWTKDDFTSHLEMIFNEETRALLKQKTINDLVHYTNEAGEFEFIINVNFYSIQEETGDQYESVTIFYFKKFEDVWKLYSIEYAG